MLKLLLLGCQKKKKVKRQNGMFQPFCKMRAEEKDRILLEYFVKPSVAQNSIKGQLLNTQNIECNMHNLPDMIRDKENVDIYRIERYFTSSAWRNILKLIQNKNKCIWTCSAIKSKDSISCNHCLNWYHFSSTSLNKIPKKRNWFCKPCIAKQ